MDGDGHFSTALVAGAMAGLSVDMSLFPIDTIKTRLQSSDGFWRAGGFRNIYSGLSAAAAGSMPTAALFFCTYELVKKAASQSGISAQAMPLAHSAAASAGEVMACLIRVPTEVVKQRAQSQRNVTPRQILLKTLRTEGIPGMYRGFFTTVLREVPFSFLQFPLWELLKKEWAVRTGQEKVDAWQSAVCGAVAGAMAAGFTTPLDVAKTRIMLAKPGTEDAKGHMLLTLKRIQHQQGVKGLFAGVVPRMTWISFGGAIFLGVYDKMKAVLSDSIAFQT